MPATSGVSDIATCPPSPLLDDPSDLLGLFTHSVMTNSANRRTTEHQVSLSSIISQSMLKFMSTESVMPSNHLILCNPSAAFNLSCIRVFSNESALCVDGQSIGASASVLPMNIQD